MTKKKQQPIELEEEPKVEEFMEIGGSPVPGITLRQILQGHTGVVMRVAWSPDGNYLASPAADKTVNVWNVIKGECIKSLSFVANSLMNAAWSPDGKELACVSDSNELTIINTKDWKKRIFKTNNRNYIGLDWSPHNSLLALYSMSAEGISIVDPKAQQEIAHIDNAASYVQDVKWSPKGDMIASSSIDLPQKIKIWNPKNGKLLYELAGHKGNASCLDWSHSKDLLASGGQDNTIRIWNGEIGTLVQVLEGHTDEVISISFSMDDRLLASKSKDNTLRIWRTDNWENICTFKERDDEGWWGLVACLKSNST